MSAQQLSDLIRFARHNSPFYQDLYAPLSPHADRLTDLPVVDQQEFWEANTLHGSRVLTGPLSEATVYKTGGTTGAPKFSVYTRDEWRTFVTSFGQGLVDTGLRPGHRVADLFYAGELYASFLFVLDSLTHAPVDNVRLPIGGGAPLESTIPTLRDLAAQVLAGTPTTLCRLAEQAVASGARLDSVELLLFGGEALFDDQRRLLAAAFPAPRRVPSDTQASTPASSAAPYPAPTPACTGPSPRTRSSRSSTTPPMSPSPNRVGPAGSSSPASSAASCRSSGTPCGDRAEWTGTGPGHFRILGRAEEGVRVGPVSLYTQDAQDAVASADTAGHVVGMQLVVRRWDGRDGLVLRLATAPGDDTSGAVDGGREALAKAVLTELETVRPLYPDSVRAGFVHPLSVEWARHRDLTVNPRSGKLVRVLDERPTA